MNKQPLYLDNSATTKPVSTIPEAILPYITDYWHNPSSTYSQGKRVREKIEEVREQTAKLIGAKPNEIYFTSGAAESNNWALQGWSKANNHQPVITSAIEHKSVKECAFWATTNRIVYPNEHGEITGSELKEVYKSLYWATTSLVSIMAANNEIGTVNNIKELADITHWNHGCFHTDATQYLAYNPINVKDMDIDMLSASAQKLGGFKGTGFLYIKEGIEVSPLIYGAQENEMRGGTENVIGIVALGEAITQIDYGIPQQMSIWREKFINRLILEGCKLNGFKDKNTLPSIISVVLPYGISSEAFILTMESAGIIISGGSACNANSPESSYVLKAIGLTDEQAGSTIRITLPKTKDLAEQTYIIDRFMAEFKKAVELLR